MEAPSLVKRIVVVAFSAAITVVLLVGGVAYLALNIDWNVPDPAALSGPSTVRDRTGEVLARFTSEVDRRIVPLDDVSEVAWRAIVASEDERFFEHRGVDPPSLIRAIVTNVRSGQVQQGGSTLTQQYVKNAYVGNERSLTRKVREAVISVALERNVSKEQILEDYLNTVYFGEGAYGIEAAARTYYGITAGELDLDQGATLAQLLPAPSVRNPRQDPEGAQRRRDALLRKMAALGFIEPAEAEAAEALPVVVLPRQQQAFREPYFVEYVRKQLVVLYGEEAVLTGSLDVTTTLDPSAQSALAASVAENLPLQEDRPGIDAGAVAIHPATGEILAMYGGRDFATSSFDLATQARRRPGSTFKPFAFIAALESGVAADASYRAPARFDKGDLCDPGWGPANAGGRGYGRLDLDDALANSVNTVFAQLGCEPGPEAIAEVAARLGNRTQFELTAQISIGGFGTNTTALEQADAFATIANDGLDCPAHAILRVLGPDGSELPREPEVAFQPDGSSVSRFLDEDRLEARDDRLKDRDTDGCYQAVEADIVRITTQTLTRVVSETTGKRADIGRPQAGKTGTTDDEVDAWFAGFTPDLAMVVRIGDTTETELTNIEGFRRVQGGTIPALIWHDAAEVILADVPPNTFLEPGEEGIRFGRRPGPMTTTSPEPGPSPIETEPDIDPSPTPSPTAEPSDGPTLPGGTGGGTGGDDGGGCIPFLQNCDPDPSPSPSPSPRPSPTPGPSGSASPSRSPSPSSGASPSPAPSSSPSPRASPSSSPSPNPSPT